MHSVHDNEIISYSVNLKAGEIAMKTLRKEDKLTVEYLLIFNGVLAHYFENEINGSIIFDVEESDINTFLKDNKRLLTVRKAQCWPIYYDNLEELINKLRKRKYSYYIISSSYGLSGWVLAKNFNIINA